MWASSTGQPGTAPVDQDWVRLQAQLVSLSIHGHQALVEDQANASRAVIDAVQEVVNQIQLRQ